MDDTEPAAPRYAGPQFVGGEHTMTEIAEQVGCSRATLYRVLDADGAQVSA